MKELDQLQVLVDELNESNSSSHKKTVLAKHPECKKILERVHNTFETFGVTSKSLLKRDAVLSEWNESKYTSIYPLLDDLADRRLSGHGALDTILDFMYTYKEHWDLILKVIDRNLKTRANAKLINNIWPDLIKTFNVALAKDMKKLAKKNMPDFEKEVWYASRKLNGLRTETEFGLIGHVKFLSRRGHEFYSLDNLKNIMIQEIDPSLIPEGGVVFDGEGCVLDKNGMDDWNAALSGFKTSKDEYQVEHPHYYVFDVLKTEEFRNGESDKTLSERYANLKIIFEDIDHPQLTMVEQIRIKSYEHLNELYLTGLDLGWEGLILRKDIPYEGIRSIYMLKYKPHVDAEYEIVSTENSEQNLVIDGVVGDHEVFSAAGIMHKGHPVSIGIGWKKAERLHYYDYPEDLIGVTITVRYAEETKNDEGTVSLFHPRVIAVHGKHGRIT